MDPCGSLATSLTYLASSRPSLQKTLFQKQDAWYLRKETPNVSADPPNTHAHIRHAYVYARSLYNKSTTFYIAYLHWLDRQTIYQLPVKETNNILQKE